FAVRPRCESPLSAVMRRIEQARAVASAVLAPPRLVAASRRCAPARPPVVVHAAPTSTPRPREHRAAPRGRDGGERDDGSGDSDGDGGGSDPLPARRDDDAAGGWR